MEFWTRRRDTTILIGAVVFQLILLGYQVRGDDDLPLIRAWAVGAISPLNKGLHGTFSFLSSGWSDYVWLVDARSENERLQRELNEYRLETEKLRRALERYRRQDGLVSYQETIVSQTLLAEVIGGGANARGREIVLDKGRRDGVLPGMAVIVADGVVGKVQASYPGSSLVVMINDADSGVGVILGDSRVRGVLRGQDGDECLLDYVAHEVSVRIGETIYTSGDDRVYPKGLRVGAVARVEEGAEFQHIYVQPYARLDRLDEVLVITAGVHQDLPPRWETQVSETLLPSPGDPEAARSETPPGTATDADRVVESYRRFAESDGRNYGVGLPGSRPPDFNAGHPVSAAAEEAEEASAASDDEQAASLPQQP